MTKIDTLKKKTSIKKGQKKTHSNKVTIDRRREWRLDLPLPAIIEGKLPNGKSFKENTILENISSTGAYFCLDAGIIVSSELKLIVEVPDKLSEGKKLKLCLEGITIRLEEPEKESKKQGVALRFYEEFQFKAEKQK
jgi:c-di-GMP-binding flagellar brake protein YcgR